MIEQHFFFLSKPCISSGYTVSEHRAKLAMLIDKNLLLIKLSNWQKTIGNFDRLTACTSTTSHLLNTFLFLLCTFPAFSQNFSFDLAGLSPQVKVQNTVLTNAWAGGLNSAQFSVFDLHNGDNISDLVVFDRYNNRTMTFVGNGDLPKTYTYRPDLEGIFPVDLENWLLLVDYNLDGEKDIFSYTPQGIRLFKNTFKSTGKIAWESIADPIYTQGFSSRLNLFVASSDIPAITDIDDDGDIDVLTFDFSGNVVEFHKNFSKEEKNNTNELIFRRQGFCWGNFYKEHCRDLRFDIDCQTGQIGNELLPQKLQNNTSAKTLHSGNSLLIIDANNDQKKDALFGHITCQNVAFLANTNTNQSVLFKTATYDYPAVNPINFRVFPAMYAGNFSGNSNAITDIIASPNTYQNEGNLINFQQSAWLYTKDNTGVFQLKQTDFLQNTMIDLGENASPLLLDIDGDGDQDFLVGNGGIRSDKGYRGSLFLYLNKGSKQNPIFELESTDFLGISEQLFTQQNTLISDLKPFLADLNADGVQDLGFVCGTLNDLEIRYLTNKGARTGVFILNTKELNLLPKLKDFTLGDSPVFVDIDQDGDQDLLVGKTFGTINFFRNIGTGSTPVFELQQITFGGLNTDYQTRNLNLAIADLNTDNKLDLLTSDAEGKLKVFSDFLSQTKLKADSTLGVFVNKIAYKSKLAGKANLSLGDLNADNLPDLILGDNTGGLRILKNTSRATNLKPDLNNIALFYPNPSTGFVYGRFPAESQIEVFDLLGQCVLQQNTQAETETVLDCNTLPNGLYMFRVFQQNGLIKTNKILIIR